MATFLCLCQARCDKNYRNEGEQGTEQVDEIRDGRSVVRKDNLLQRGLLLMKSTDYFRKVKKR
jgi:hypothetical protein